MDEILENSWKNRTKPFDNESLCLNDLVRISDLRQSILAIFEILQIRYGNEELFVNDDWHEHDGFITPSRKTSWQLIEETLKSDKSLYESRHGDFCVYNLLFTRNRDFVLRIYVSDEDDDTEYPGIWGEFTVTSAPELLKEIFDSLPKAVLEKIEYKNSHEMFSKSYAG